MLRPVSGLPIRRRHHLVRLELEVVPQAAEDGRIIFDDKNATHKVTPKLLIESAAVTLWDRAFSPRAESIRLIRPLVAAHLR
jgi:hypothetical protein